MIDCHNNPQKTSHNDMIPPADTGKIIYLHFNLIGKTSMTTK